MGKQSIYIIGIGRFGTSFVETLNDKKVGLVVIDSDQKKVEKLQYSGLNASFLNLDATDIEALEESGVVDADNVVVAVSNMETSIIICTLLKDLNVKNIAANATSLVHKRVLKSLGINQILLPEHLAGKEFAYQTLLNKCKVNHVGQEYIFLKIIIRSPSLLGLNVLDVIPDSIDKSTYKICAVKKNSSQDDNYIYELEGVTTERLDFVYIMAHKETAAKINAFLVKEAENQ